MLFTCLKKHTSLLVKAIPCTELCHILKMQSKKRKKKKSPDAEVSPVTIRI